ncbi:uncharacterized protein LOC111872899 [Cryptotermes secundus]|uniref:uncharacterized protein LOC111872899 n=1 Tax=Cryptotermes secundus TaxID=105785 RepID=UPI000CD7B4A4|nr:uncharacterized protein LOC111872899 [Cryptotermes secundus]
MERVGKQKREVVPVNRSMDTPKKSYGRHKNSFWKPGEGVNQHFDVRHRLLETYRKKIPCRWENQPRGGHKQRCFSHLKNSSVPPKKCDMGKAQLHRKWATASTCSKKNKNQQDLRFKILQIRTQKCSQPDEAANCVHKSKPRKPELKAAASGWARVAVTSLRALILSKTTNRNPKSGVAVSAKNFKNGYDAKHESNTSEVMFQRRERRFKSDCSFKENRIVSGDSVTLVLTGKGDSNNDDTLTEQYE